MKIVFNQFAESSSGGISSLGLNLKSFVFQLITFLIVLLLLRRYVFPKLVATLESRREALEKSLEHARQTEVTLKSAEEKAGQILHRAREQADASLADARARAKEVIAESEQAASSQSSRIIKEAEDHLQQEYKRLHKQLREELVNMVVVTTEKVIDEKLDKKKDRELIEREVKGLAL